MIEGMNYSLFSGGNQIKITMYLSKKDFLLRNWMHSMMLVIMLPSRQYGLFLIVTFATFDHGTFLQMLQSESLSITLSLTLNVLKRKALLGNTRPLTAF